MLARPGVPTFERFEKPFANIPNAWREWVAHSKLFKQKNDAIVDVLINNGYKRESALAEVEKATQHPYVLGAARSQRALNKTARLVSALGQLKRLDSQARGN